MGHRARSLVGLEGILSFPSLLPGTVYDDVLVYHIPSDGVLGSSTCTRYHPVWCGVLQGCDTQRTAVTNFGGRYGFYKTHHRAKWYSFILYSILIVQGSPSGSCNVKSRGRRKAKRETPVTHV